MSEGIWFENKVMKRLNTWPGDRNIPSGRKIGIKFPTLALKKSIQIKQTNQTRK